MQAQFKDDTSGKIRFEGDKFFWDCKGMHTVEININEIVVIGEYTNSDGPWFDDWFFTFVLKRGGWSSVSMYAEGIEELLDVLCKRFDPDLRQNFLTASTTWNSAVLYPVSLKGKQLFKLEPPEAVKPPKTFLGKLFSAIGFGDEGVTQTVFLSDEVKHELENANR